MLNLFYTADIGTLLAQLESFHHIFADDDVQVYIYIGFWNCPNPDESVYWRFHFLDGL